MTKFYAFAMSLALVLATAGSALAAPQNNQNQPAAQQNYAQAADMNSDMSSSEKKADDKAAPKADAKKDEKKAN